MPSLFHRPFYTNNYTVVLFSDLWRDFLNPFNKFLEKIKIKILTSDVIYPRENDRKIDPILAKVLTKNLAF